MMLTSHSGEEGVPPATTTKTDSGLWIWRKGKRVSEPGNPYPMRKDPLEVKRLNLQHALHRDALRANVFAPIHQPRRILDVAGGTGIWARALAAQFPQARVESFDKDILPFQWAEQGLPSGSIPANFVYQQGDALGRFPYEDARFDYVHARYISPFIAQSQWPGVLLEIVRVTRPGGWVELVDGPAAVSNAPGYAEIEQAIEALARERFGFYDPGPHLPTWFAQMGLERIHHEMRVIGEGDLQKFQPRLAEMIDLACQSIQEHLVGGGYITATRFQACMRDLRAELVRAGITVTVHIVYGQKPVVLS